MRGLLETSCAGNNGWFSSATCCVVLEMAWCESSYDCAQKCQEQRRRSSAGVGVRRELEFGGSWSSAGPWNIAVLKTLEHSGPLTDHYVSTNLVVVLEGLFWQACTRFISSNIGRRETTSRQP